MNGLELSDEETERLSQRSNNRDSDDNRERRSDEAEEEPGFRKDSDNEDGTTKRLIDPSTSKKRIIKNPQPKLNAERIQGRKGVQTIETYFQGFEYHGKGHEKSDLDRVMKRLEHWAHRLYPKYCYDDFLEKMEVLGNKKGVQVFLKKYRQNMITADSDIVEGLDEIEAERGEELVVEQAPIDEFDKLIAEQIEKQRANEKISDVSTSISDGNVLGSADTAKPSELSDEVRARIEANRKLAIERKMARIKRLEEETKRKQSEESRKISEMAMPESQIFEEVSNNLEKSRDAEIIESSAVHSGNNEVASMEENIEHLEESLEQNPPLFEEPMEISTTAPEITEIPEAVGDIELPQTRRRSLEKSIDDSENLLTHEQLLLAIDGAMEEIIGNKETLKNIVL